AVGLVGPQVLVGRGALAVVDELPVGGPPVSLAAVFQLPVREVEAVPEVLVPLVDVGDVGRARVRARQLLDLQVLEPALVPFGFEGEVALPRRALVDRRDFLAVDLEADGAVIGDDAVVVPFAAPLGPVLARQAAFGSVRMGPLRLAMGAPDAEEVSLARGG